MEVIHLLCFYNVTDLSAECPAPVFFFGHQMNQLSLEHKVSTKYITLVILIKDMYKLIKDMYKDATTFVWTCDGDTTDLPITIVLH